MDMAMRQNLGPQETAATAALPMSPTSSTQPDTGDLTGCYAERGPRGRDRITIRNEGGVLPGAQGWSGGVNLGFTAKLVLVF